jgi:hypothetical protein
VKSIQIALDHLRLMVRQGSISPSEHSHAVALVLALEERVGEHRAALLALETQLAQARKIVQTIDGRLAGQQVWLHPSMQAAFVHSLARRAGPPRGSWARIANRRPRRMRHSRSEATLQNKPRFRPAEQGVFVVYTSLSTRNPSACSPRNLTTNSRPGSLWQRRK